MTHLLSALWDTGFLFVCAFAKHPSPAKDYHSLQAQGMAFMAQIMAQGMASLFKTVKYCV